MDKVGAAIQRVVSVFQERNPTFQGRVSLLGHGLGGVIAFDLLANQGILKSALAGVGLSVLAVCVCVCVCVCYYRLTPGAGHRDSRVRPCTCCH